MKTDDELIQEIEARTVNALCFILTDRPEAERQLRHARDNIWELQKQRKERNDAASQDTDRLDFLSSKLNNSYLELCHFKYSSNLDGEPASLYDPRKPYYIGGQYGPCGETLRAAIDTDMSNQRYILSVNALKRISSIRSVISDATNQP